MAYGAVQLSSLGQGGKFLSRGAEGNGGARLGDGCIRGMRAGECIAQHHLRNAKTINHGNGHLKAAFAAIGESRFRQFKRNLRGHNAKGHEFIGGFRRRAADEGDDGQQNGGGFTHGFSSGFMVAGAR